MNYEIENKAREQVAQAADEALRTFIDTRGEQGNICAVSYPMPKYRKDYYIKYETYDAGQSFLAKTENIYCNS